MEKLSLDSYNIVELEKKIRDKITYCWKNGLSDRDVKSWLDNFKGKAYDVEIEHKLAYILLDNFMFINHDEVLQLCRDLYSNLIHEIAVKSKDGYIDYDNIIFLPIGNPSESSSLIMYFFRLANDIPKDKFSYHLPTYNKQKTIIFIDDFAGTGNQAFDDNIVPLLNSLNISFDQVYYLCLVSTDKAIIKGQSHKIKVISSLILDSRAKLFNINSYTRFNNELIEMLVNFIDRYKYDVKWHPLGYGDSQLAFGFYYNVPDNSLPVFWADNSNWRPIFKRFHKKYQSETGGNSYEHRYPFI